MNINDIIKQATESMTCPICKEIFEKRRASQIYCSRPCAFKGLTSSPQFRARCSARMKNKKAMFGYINSPESRRKMAERAIGRVPSELGRMKSSETHKKLQSGHKFLSPYWKKGAESLSWKGGVTPLNQIIRTSTEYANWRKAVFERDDYRCLDCGAKTGKGMGNIILNADHIYPFAWFPRLRLVLENGRTLCEDCHKKTPSYLNPSFLPR